MSNKGSYILVDCDSFYASCEKVFRPDLRDTPVVVLSNNDGFVIAACPKAKACGIKVISDPYYKVEEKIRKLGIKVFSANFALYGDISQRVLQTLSQFSPDIEIYSIDEAFIHLKTTDIRLTNLCREMRDAVWKQVGIPVSIGIAPTKTLAKIATHFAKKNRLFGGVFDLSEQEDINVFLDMVEVENIWGVGRAYSKLLHKNGIHTACDLKNLSYQFARKKMTVVGLRTVKELQGIPCFPLDNSPMPQKNITRSRSFGHLVETESSLKEAVGSYMSRACEKLREQNSLAWTVHVFISTHPHKKEPQYSNWGCGKLPAPTADTPTLIKVAHRLLNSIYRSGYRYLKCGVMLSNLIPEKEAPEHLFLTPYQHSADHDLMKAVDIINKELEPGLIRFGSVGLDGKPWKMRQAHRSNRYTTKWEEIVTAKAR